ncbi:MAG: Na/Pi symporter [bacterium]|nr:MAG: Na/Pi symporter [bacterium]
MNNLRELLNKLRFPLNVIKLIFFLYLFMFSLELMGTSLKMFGKDFALTLIQTTTNPVVGLFIGILATSLIQSSSSTTSIVVGMVGGGALTVPNAIPIIMGANIGTSVTNSIVSLSQINRTTEFRRAFAAATVHDFFNVLSVIVIFPIQYFTNYLGILADFLGKEFQLIGGLQFLSPVKLLTKPLANLLIEQIGNHAWILFFLSLVLLLLSLKQMVDALKILVVKRAEAWFDRYLFKTAIRSFVVGLLLTFMVQSSSITTSLVVPMAGAGLLTLKQIFPYTLGANIGTTITAILAALVTQNLSAIVVAFSHLFFNISGIIIWWPLNFIPIRIAKEFANMATKNRMIPIIYVIISFFIIPITIIYFLK